MKKLTSLLIVALLIASCQSEHENKLPSHNEMDNTTSSTSTENFGLDENLQISPPMTQNKEKQIEPPSLEKGSKIIRDGNMRIEVDDLRSSKTYIDQLVAKHGAYYEKEIFRNDEYTQNYSLKLRIPSSKFSTIVSELESGEGIILEKFINAKDVTEEYLDLEIRLDNNKAYLKRYKELLGKAKTIKEMIAIQEKIRQIEMLIDGSMGRMKFLNDKVKFSTLAIELTTQPKEYVAEAPPSFLEDIIEALKRGFSGLLYFVLILANLWPIILGVLLIWVFRSKLFRKLKRKVV